MLKTKRKVIFVKFLALFGNFYGGAHAMPCNSQIAIKSIYNAENIFFIHLYEVNACKMPQRKTVSMISYYDSNLLRIPQKYFNNCT